MPVRVAVVGAGAFGSLHLSTLMTMPEAEVVGVADTSVDRRVEIASRWDIAGYDSVRALIERSRPQAVIVATPEDRHEAPVITALTAGCDVLVEKPFALSLDAVDRMIEMARRCGRLLCVGHVLRFSPPHLHLKGLIDSGQMGEVMYMSARRNGARSLATNYSRASITFVGAIHDIDLCLWYTNQKVVEVVARAWPPGGGASPEMITATLQLANGALAVLESGWVVPEAAPHVPDAFLEVVGTEATAFVTADRVVTWTKWEVSELSFPLDDQEPLRAELSHFLACVAEGKSSEVLRCGDARRAVEVALKIEESRRGGAVTYETAV